MAGLMESIFGGGTQALTKERYARANLEAQDIIDSASKIQAPGEAIGTSFGTPFGKEFGQGLARGIFGDPEKEAATEQDAAMKEISDKYSPNQPEYHLAVADYARKQGLYEESALAFGKANEIKKANQQQTATDLAASTLTDYGYVDQAALVKSGAINSQQASELITSITKPKEVVDPKDGNTYLATITREGEIKKKGSLVKPAKMEQEYLQGNENKNKFRWKNSVTGELGEQVFDTLEDGERERTRLAKAAPKIAAAENSLSLLAEIKELSGKAGFEYGAAKQIAGQPSYILNEKIQTIQSDKTFQKLLDIKAGGGTLGAVSEVEINLLMASISALNPSVGEEEFLKQIEKIEFHFENARRQLLGLETKINYNSSYYKDKVIVSKDDQGKPKAYITSEISGDRVDITDQYDFSKNKTLQKPNLTITPR